MSDRSTDQAAQSDQRDQAEGERNDQQEARVTRGSAGGDDSTRQQSVADRNPAEGSRESAT